MVDEAGKTPTTDGLTEDHDGISTGEPAVTETVGTDNPEAYIARDRRRALATGTEIPDRAHGSAIFADISGFTPLTEALRNELGPQRGAEVLTAHLDRVFHSVISALDRFGGNVIYFAGDAITGWIDGDDGRRAVASGLAMLEVMQEVGQIVTQAGTTVQLALKVAVATGDARRAVVGDPDIQRIEVLAGGLLDELAAAEQQAKQGELVVDSATLTALGDRISLSQQLVSPDSARSFGVVDALNVQVSETPLEEPPPLDTALVKQWLLPVVYDRISTGRGEFLAELRSAYPVFVRFSGIDFDADDEALSKLDTLVVRAQQIFDAYGGNVLQLTLGDKGAYLYGVFGSPIAHEDDAARAAAAALELCALDQQSAARDIQIGIAHGGLRSGTYGHAMRRTFVCLGDAVNLAARLMSSAPPGSIYAAQAVKAAAGDGFIWQDLEPLTLKGKAEPVVASSLTSSLERISRRSTRFELPMVGRDDELAVLDAALADARNAHSHVIGICADAGLGKSRLVSEFVRHARRQSILVAFGECQAFGVNTSYFVWREIWRRLLNVEDDEDLDTQRSKAEDSLRKVDPVLVARAPLLSDVIGVSIPDTELTASFDAKLRKSSLEDLLARCLIDRAAGEPVILVLEDCHWIDSLSRDLLEALARATAAHRVLIVAAYRPAAESGGNLGIAQLPQFSERMLTELGALETREVIRAKSEQIFNLTETPQALIDLVAERAEGNPFYAEELLNYVAGEGVDPGDASALQRLELPDSLHSLILSRIDALTENRRRTLKVASVIGRLFRAPMLSGVYPELGSLEDVLERLDNLRQADLVTLDQAETLSYLFRHVVTQEVAYNSMPFAIRAGLHRSVGEYIESAEAADLEPHLDLLAHHFWHSDRDDKKREYLTRAEASARKRYANATAIDYSEKLLELVDGIDRGEALLRLGTVFELTGEWARAEEIAEEALTIATAFDSDSLTARAETALGRVARKHGQYADALQHLQKAISTFEALGDDEGLAPVLQEAGTIASQQGDFSAANASWEQSLAIRERLDDQSGIARLYGNMAIAAYYSGDADRAQECNDRALSLYRAIGDRWGIGALQNNIGMIETIESSFASARTRFEEAIRLCGEAGDPWMVALAQNNLGNATRGLGEHKEACAHYSASLEAYRRYDDLWAIAHLLEDIALLAIRTEDARVACELLGASEILRDEISAPRDNELTETIGQQMSNLRDMLGNAAFDTAMTSGRRLSAPDAIETALSYTRTTQARLTA